MSRNKLKRYTGAEVAQPKSIAEQLLAGTKLGNLLYGKQETYKDGDNQERKDASFKESANGQLVQRMGETAKDAGGLVATGLAFGNPLTASEAMAPLIAGSQAYWIGHGLNDGAQRIENIGEGVKNFVEDPSWQNAGAIVKEVPMLALDVAGAVPVAKTATTVAKQMIKPTPKYTPAEQVVITQPTTSKLTEAERLGIPKGERNQPAKPRSTRAIEYDITSEGLPTKEFLDDFKTYKKALSGEGRKVDITDMFDSPWYRERLTKQGLTEEQANQLISRLKARTGPDQIMVADDLNYIRDFSHAEEGFPIGMTPERTTQLGRHSTHPSFNGKSLIQLTTKVDPEDVILHEIGGHRSQPLVSDFAHLYDGQKMTDLGTKHYLKVGAPSDYGIQWDEVRARALTIAKQMSNAGWNPNSPEQVNVWLNKHIFTNNPTNVNQGALYYDRPRFIKAVATGLKQGGKIENPA